VWDIRLCTLGHKIIAAVAWSSITACVSILRVAACLALCAAGCLFVSVVSELQCVSVLQAPTSDCGATAQVTDTHQRDGQGEGLGWVGSWWQPRLY
jgi:hypothetical protein